MRVSASHSSTAAAFSASRCRSGRCITWRSTRRCRTSCTATCRTMARCAARRGRPKARAPASTGSATRGSTASAAASRASPFPIPRMPTSSGRRATATRLRGTTRGPGPRAGGAKWSDVTKNVAALPAWGVVSKIEPSHFEAGTAYVAVDAHLMDSREPYIFKTADYGASWSRINGDLPDGHPLSYVKAVAENPNKRGMLFAGTGHGFFYSTDEGAHWTELSAGLPHAPVSWIVVQKQFHDVVVSTYGRGLYVLDDITPLEQEPA